MRCGDKLVQAGIAHLSETFNNYTKNVHQTIHR